MAVWDYNLSPATSRRLRRAIQEDDYAGVKQALIDAYNEIYDLIGDEDIFDEYDRDGYIDDIEMLDTEPDIDSDIYENDIEDSFNYELDNFFDFCDNLRIWVGLD